MKPPLTRTSPKNLIVLVCLLQGSLLAGAQPNLTAFLSPHSHDRILIKPKAGISPKSLADIHTKFKTKILTTFQSIGSVQIVSVPPGENIGSLISNYEASGLVDYAEPDYIRNLNLAPNDPKYLDGTLWALNNWGQNSGTVHADINATNAWSILSSASNIVVAILDSGIRYTHEDLSANMWTNPSDGSHGTNAVTGTTDPMDVYAHGTEMAGVIGAVGNNAKGVTGVAWKVQMMACKCFSDSGSGNDSSIIACIDYARAHGAKIMSASFDGTGFGQSLSNAIFTARQAGIIFVASCGNNSANIDAVPHYPAAFAIDNVVSVAYTTRNDTLGQFSNYGATNVDLAAPGDQIYSTHCATDSFYYPPSGSINLGGTSFAAAYVSGALALMLAKYPNETHQQTIAHLLASTDPLPALSGKCATGGRLNLLKALNLMIRLTPIPTATGQPIQLRVGSDAFRSCIIQTSPDLRNWSPIYTNTTSSAGIFDFTDGISGTQPHLFYRAVSAL